MKYVLMFCDTPELYGEVDEVAAKAVHDEIWAWFGEHDAAGRIADMGAHLQPVTTATTVKSGDGAPVVVDGPFSEAKELIAGYWVWQVRSMDEAIEWVKRCPNPMPGESEIEIRQVFEAEDFGDNFTPELREQEDRVRSQAAKNN